MMYYHCAALLEQTVINDPKDLQGNPIGEIDHKIIYICPKYLNKEGFKDGLKEGITQNRHDTVLRMYKKGLDIKMIAEIARIAKKQVNDILIKNK